MLDDKTEQLQQVISSSDGPTVELAVSPGFEPSDRQNATGSNPVVAVGVVAKGRAPRFADQTELLLRSRLKAAAIDLMVVLGLGYVGNFLAGSTQWQFLRTLILGSVIGSYFLLRWKSRLSMLQMRSIELTLFGGVAIQMCLMMYSRTEHFANQGEAASIVGVQQFFFTAFCLHILTYGIFMPNTWRRAAVVMTCLACMPYLIAWYQQSTNTAVADLLATNHAGSPLPTTFIAALIGTFGSHIIHRTRREAFQAKQIMQYRLLEQIGSGGMGEVYRAEHLLMKRPCAMKLIKSEKGTDASTIAKFEREVIATARLSHWNTIDIYDYGHTEDGTFYYVMELLEGDNLQSLVLRNGPLPPGRAIYLLIQACEALQEAHDVGLIHRDIKPANIFAAHRGGKWDVCKVLDFGLVRESRSDLANGDTSTSESSTRKGRASFSGTPGYMPPEQVTHYDSVDGRSDLYALGCVAYFLLTGRAPFEGKTTIDFIVAHATSKPPPIRGLNSNFSSELETALLRCLEKDPASRFPTVREFGKALSNCPESTEWDSDRAAAWWASLE